MKREILSVFTQGKLTGVYRRDEAGTVELLLLPAGTEERICRADCAAEPLVQAKLAEDDAPAFFSGGRTMRNSPTTRTMTYVGQNVQTEADKTVISTILTDPRGLQYTHTLTLFADNPAAETQVTVENTGDVTRTLEMLSSFTMGSLSPFAQGLAPGTIMIHRMRSTWSAEGRLVSEPAEELQLEPSWKQYSANSVRFGSVGSFPVRGFVPFCAVEDAAHRVTWAAATTQGSSWQIELYRRDYGLSMSGGMADREFGAWCKTLVPGETFTAPKAVLTAVRGGVDEAAQALAENTRHSIDPKLPAWDREMPVLFNEFCSTWGRPTEETVLRHIRALKGRRLGCYVIDAGWYDDESFEDANRLGEWEVSRKAFPHGLKPVVQAIHDAGMKAGIWFEFEMAGRDEPDCFNHTEWLLKRNAVPITAGDRRFWDMRKPEVQEYLAGKVIDFLRENRLDYLKVDYNETIGLGCDGEESLGEGLRQQIKASRAFFARIRRELPDLVLELCASGGHRLCHSFTELACMASFSDAHECDEIPIIAANMHRMILPRQSQIWAVVKAGQSIQKLYYQICSGLLGRLCFSGEPDALSLEQWAVIEEGIRFYAQAAPIIDRGTSHRFGPPVLSYRAPQGWQAMVRKGKKQTLVVLHTFGNAPQQITLPVTGRIAAAFARGGLTVTQTNALCVAGLQDFDAAAILLENEV
nr:alpha-galactosidase [uncultured Gemmiger sp.]